MYTFYLAGAVSLVVSGLYVRHFMQRSVTPYIDSCFATAGTFLVAAIVAAIAGLVINSNLPQKKVVGGPYKLVAMRSADGVSAKFIYGTGSISGTVFYNVYVQNEDGSITPYQVPADSSVRIVEDADLHSEGSWIQTVASSDYSSPLAPWAIGQDWKTYSNSFRVPVGTVVLDFSVK